MHGTKETTTFPRTIWTFAHLGMVGFVAWLYFGQGIDVIGNWFQQDWKPGNFLRRILLFSFSVIFWLWMTATAFIFLKRKFSWSECFAVIGAVGMYQLGFSFFGATSTSPVVWIDYLAIGIFILGSILNTGSEWQRKIFKENLKNEGKLCTQGLFKVVRHPNYLGDILWALGWAILTGNNWAFVISIICIASFIFLFIPQLSDYLRSRYTVQYQNWENHTKALIPWIY